MDREGITAEQEIVGYLDAAGPVHDDLRRILTQVSGFSMMLFTSDKRRLLPADLIHDAARDQAQTAERIRALRVPERAGHHHHHLTLAADAIAQSCAAAIACGKSGATDGERDVLVAALKSAVGQLRILATLLPGFEPVAFGQACCALHARAATG